MEKQPNRFLQQLGNLLVPKAPKHELATPQTVTNERILHELVACFEASLERESFGTSLLFNTNYLIVLHPNTYEERLPALPAIVDEAVRAFYDRLRQRKGAADKILPVSSYWYFKFGPGAEVDGQSVGRDDILVIGSLAGVSLTEPAQSEAGPPKRVKATARVRNTGVFEKLDINQLMFQHIDFRDAGTFAVKFEMNLTRDELTELATLTQQQQQYAPQPSSPQRPSALAQLTTFLADTNTEETFWVEDREVVIARREPDNEMFPNYIRLNSPYVSNPHARIRFNEPEGRFEIASFSRNETRVNEQVVARSEPLNPQWVELPDGAQILLNSIVTLQFQRTA